MTGKRSASTRPKRNEPANKKPKCYQTCSFCNTTTSLLNYCNNCGSFFCKGSNCELNHTKSHENAKDYLQLHKPRVNKFLEIITADMEELKEYNQIKLQVERTEALKNLTEEILRSHFAEIVHIKLNSASDDQMKFKIKQIKDEIDAKSKFIITMCILLGESRSEFVTLDLNNTAKPCSILHIKNKIREKGIEIGESEHDSSWIIAEEHLNRLAKAPEVNLFFTKDGRVGRISKTRKVFVGDRYRFIFKNAS